MWISAIGCTSYSQHVVLFHMYLLHIQRYIHLNIYVWIHTLCGYNLFKMIVKCWIFLLLLKGFHERHFAKFKKYMKFTCLLLKIQ